MSPLPPFSARRGGRGVLMHCSSEVLPTETRWPVTICPDLHASDFWELAETVGLKLESSMGEGVASFLFFTAFFSFLFFLFLCRFQSFCRSSEMWVGARSL